MMRKQKELKYKLAELRCEMKKKMKTSYTKKSQQIGKITKLWKAQ